MECPWLNRPNPIKPNAKVSKFEKGSSTFVCVECGKRTRKTDTMTCNQAVELCASCYAENEADNQETDQAGRAGARARPLQSGD